MIKIFECNLIPIYDNVLTVCTSWSKSVQIDFEQNKKKCGIFLILKCKIAEKCNPANISYSIKRPLLLEVEDNSYLKPIFNSLKTLLMGGGLCFCLNKSVNISSFCIL